MRTIESTVVTLEPRPPASQETDDSPAVATPAVLVAAASEEADYPAGTAGRAAALGL